MKCSAQKIFSSYKRICGVCTAAGADGHRTSFYNGYYWCGEIRKISKVPIIFLSSAADNMNIVMAVNMGADDFIAKPFDLSVLTVKVQAMLRRTYDFTETGEVLTYHGVMLQVAEAVLTYQDKKVELTRNELRILKTLMEIRKR